MKPGLLPMMLGRGMDELGFGPPLFPAGKAVVVIGPAGKSVVIIGPAGKSVAVIGPAGKSVEVPV